MHTRLERFIEAQRSAYGTALKEIRSGEKVSHWIWYIFPQLQGLGSSATSQEYGIRDLEEACAYLENETLHQRYVEILTAVQQQLQNGCSLVKLMKSDDVKLVSSATLFQAAGQRLASKPEQADKYRPLVDLCTQIFAAIFPAYQPCQATKRRILEQLNKVGYFPVIVYMTRGQFHWAFTWWRSWT